MPWNKGLKNCYTAETLRKMSLAGLGKSSPMKGKKHSVEVRRKMSILLKEKYKNGTRVPPKGMLGKKWTENQRNLITKSLLGNKNPNFGKNMSGENSPSWIKDRTKLKTRGDRRSSAYSTWRRQVWLRDNFKCKMANPDCSGRIEAHHILGYTAYPELRYKLNNGITLCHAHHPRKRAEEKRLLPYFMELVSVSKV